jgi:hypothetical protein
MTNGVISGSPLYGYCWQLLSIDDIRTVSDINISTTTITGSEKKGDIESNHDIAFLMSKAMNALEVLLHTSIDDHLFKIMYVLHGNVVMYRRANRGTICLYCYYHT